MGGEKNNNENRGNCTGGRDRTRRDTRNGRDWHGWTKRPHDFVCIFFSFSVLSFIIHKEWGKTTTKTEVVITVAGIVPVAKRATGVPDTVVPSAPTNVNTGRPGI